jgi:phosphate starvation-inducible PhoH-like protein
MKTSDSMKDNAAMSESTLTLGDPQLAIQLFGPQDTHLRKVRNQLGVAITHRNGTVKVAGPSHSVDIATGILEKLKEKLIRGGGILPEEIDALLHQAMVPATKNIAIDLRGESKEVAIGNTARRVKPRTQGQAYYIEAIRTHDLTLCSGPAGCGKTYLAVATAVEAYRAKAIRKIVLVRPAVEAGESLGYLPGDLKEKLNPYLRPLLDAINEMVDFDQVKFLMEQEVIEVIPLAYMRGRTLNQAFIILDEAQNATVAQMKMFLTRMGEGSKVVVSGDTSQVDLPSGVTSGLRDAIQRLSGIDGVSIVQLQANDIVRHPLVQRIVAAYDQPIAAAPRPVKRLDRT